MKNNGRYVVPDQTGTKLIRFYSTDSVEDNQLYIRAETHPVIAWSITVGKVDIGEINADTTITPVICEELPDVYCLKAPDGPYVFPNQDRWDGEGKENVHFDDGEDELAHEHGCEKMRAKARAADEIIHHLRTQQQQQHPLGLDEQFVPQAKIAWQEQREGLV